MFSTPAPGQGAARGARVSGQSGSHSPSQRERETERGGERQREEERETERGGERGRDGKREKMDRDIYISIYINI